MIALPRGVDIAYDDVGTGLPVVFIHGFPHNRTLWAPQLGGLMTRARCIAPDLRGFGESEVRGPYTMDAYADDVIAVMDALQIERAVIAGLSMGGYVAFEILRQAPERVTRLALLATSASPDGPKRAAQRRAAIASLAHGRFAGVTKRMLPRLIHADLVASEIGAEVRAMAQRVGGDAFLRQQTAILARPDSRPVLPSIRVPTLIGVGDGDTLTPHVESDRMHRAIPGSSLHVFGRCGHLPALERSAMTTALLRGWLAEP